jgi:hypothetical protein
MPKEAIIEIVNPEHIEAVHADHQTVLLTIKHCLKNGGDHVTAKHLTLLMDCEGICHLREDFLLRGSHHHHAICKACEELCEECAKSCDTFKGDQPMAACAQACRRCAEVCRMM